MDTSSPPPRRNSPERYRDRDSSRARSFARNSDSYRGRQYSRGRSSGSSNNYGQRRNRSLTWERNQLRGFRKSFVHRDGTFFDSDYDGTAQDGWNPVYRSPSGTRYAVRGDTWGHRVRDRERKERQKMFFNSSQAKTSYVKIIFGELDRPEKDPAPWQQRNDSRQRNDRSLSRDRRDRTPSADRRSPN